MVHHYYCPDIKLPSLTSKDHVIQCLPINQGWRHACNHWYFCYWAPQNFWSHHQTRVHNTKAPHLPKIIYSNLNTQTMYAAYNLLCIHFPPRHHLNPWIPTFCGLTSHWNWSVRKSSCQETNSTRSLLCLHEIHWMYGQSQQIYLWCTLSYLVLFLQPPSSSYSVSSQAYNTHLICQPNILLNS
jgi:hypothetical protein